MITSWTSHTPQILVEFGSAGAFPQMGEIERFYDFFGCPVFFSILYTGQTVGPIFTLHSSNDVYPCKHGPFGVRTIDDVIWENMPPKPPKGGVDRQFQPNRQNF